MPAYFDYLIEGFRSARASRNVHLGYWDEPPPLTAPCSQQEFESAQARLTDIVIDLAQLHDGCTLLDVGCGFGGTLEAVAAKRSGMRMTGLNIDRRQLDICRSLAIGANRLSLVVADACALPFRPASFDRIFCVEAAFHFGSRQTFLDQAASALINGGRLVLSDILLSEPAPTAALSRRVAEMALRREYGPWPELWIEADAMIGAARRAGLQLEQRIDMTRQTLPTHRVTAPQSHDRLPPDPGAGSVLRWLHAAGHLSYLCMSFIKT